ncbi:hypothetical protein TrLO_g8285 [Triparma laevis f. longispina]|uniref:TatD related DNase n=1 Tax=Triparma laevis f. longispina TaxID=1714387 RepID=A0A9W7FAQ0_9STRA|nr:hypothetical protein TrLO_g8285 [Triparma laevis f. longispina]
MTELSTAACYLPLLRPRALHVGCNRSRAPLLVKDGRAPRTTSRSGGLSTAAASSLSAPAIIDIDCNFLHPDMPPFPDLLSHPSTISSNIVGFVSPSSNLSECAKLCALLDGMAADDVNIKTTCGIHPYEVKPDEDLEAIESTLQSSLSSPHVSCVGEVGLDYSDGFPPSTDQLPVFALQLEVAARTKTNLFLHTRAAHEDTLRVLKNVKEKHGGYLPPVVVHCFTGTPSDLEDFLSLGFYIGVTGFVLKPAGSDVLSCLSRIPKDKLMIETDSPYMGFSNCRSTYAASDPAISLKTSKERKKFVKSMYPNYPSSLTLVLDAVAKARGEGIEDVAKYTTENAKFFFGL